MHTPRQVLRFRIELCDVSPTVWRLVELDGASTFWDLHCVIQDAMGWMDRHLHNFSFDHRGASDPTLVGIPYHDPMPGARRIQAGWDLPLWRHFRKPGDSGTYNYDFGDDWQHDVEFEAVALREARTKYPRCLGGANACPPEDCGGPPGYAELQEAMVDAEHPRRAELLEWLGGPFDPAAFDHRTVKFTDPRKRLKRVLEEGQ